MPTYFSPTGNAEVWASKPVGYFTIDEWIALRPLPLAESKSIKMKDIASSYESALTYIIGHEVTSIYGTALAAALAVADFTAEDPEGLAFIRQQLKARRAELEAAVAAAPDAAAVQAIVVSFNV